MWYPASKNSITARSTTFFCTQEITEVRGEQLDILKQSAKQDPLRRARLCLHHDHSDKVQEMVIAFYRDSYVRPHRHLNKSESFHVIEGKLAVIFFDDNGNTTRRITMSTCGNGQTFLYRVSSSLCHMVIPLSEFVVIHETTTGPFVKEETEYPTWGPEEDDTVGIKTFLERITI